jgi:hypothetical protein
MGVLSDDIRIKLAELAELDNIANNEYFIKRSNNIEILQGLDHYLGGFTVFDIIQQDLRNIV